jgi:hypothetical protein
LITIPIARSRGIFVLLSHGLWGIEIVFREISDFDFIVPTLRVHPAFQVPDNAITIGYFLFTFGIPVISIPTRTWMCPFFGHTLGGGKGLRMVWDGFGRQNPKLDLPGSPENTHPGTITTFLHDNLGRPFRALLDFSP